MIISFQSGEDFLCDRDAISAMPLMYLYVQMFMETIHYMIPVVYSSNHMDTFSEGHNVSERKMDKLDLVAH